jgi:hypothetical protein
MNMADSTGADAPASMTVYLSPRWFALALVCLVLGLEAAHLVTNVLRYEYGHETQFGLVRQFNLDEEANLPTWYSASAILIASLLLGMIGFVKRRLREPDTRHWLWLAFIFLYLSADEAARIHEMSEPFTQRLHFTGFFFYPWIIGGALIVLIVGLSYLRFLFRLPRDIRGLIVIAGSLYVGGALGVESIGARLDELYGFKNLKYSLVVGIEELCEMAGILIFLYALMQYAGRTIDAVAFSFRDASMDESGPRQEEVLKLRRARPGRVA